MYSHNLLKNILIPIKHVLHVRIYMYMYMYTHDYLRTADRAQVLLWGSRPLVMSGRSHSLG